MPDNLETTISIPSQPSKSILFQYDFKARKFQFDHYLPEMTDNTYSKQEISDFLSEIEDHLTEWHQASDRIARIVIDTFLVLLVCAAVGFVISTMAYSLTYYQILMGLLFLSGTLTGILIIRIIILDVYKIKRFKILQSITEKFFYDLDKTAVSVKNSDYMWTFPVNFPASIKLQLQEEDQDQLFFLHSYSSIIEVYDEINK